MSETTNETKTSSTKTKSSAGASSAAKAEAKNMLTTPMAIVVAGALVALAIYFGSGGGTAGTDNQKVAGSGTGNTQAAADKPTPAPATVGDMAEVTDEDHIRGASDAKVTIVEYSDLECPFCKRFHGTMQQVLDEYPDDVRWVYRHAPLAQLHSKAAAEANASECAAEQGKFWEFVDLVFETTQGNDSLDLDTLPELAQEAEVANVSQFETCVEDEKYADKVDEQLQDAYSAGLRGTPYSVVIGPDGTRTPINGAQQYPQVKATIDSLL